MELINTKNKQIFNIKPILWTNDLFITINNKKYNLYHNVYGYEHIKKNIKNFMIVGAELYETPYPFSFTVQKINNELYINEINVS